MQFNDKISHTRQTPTGSRPTIGAWGRNVFFCALCASGAVAVAGFLMGYDPGSRFSTLAQPSDSVSIESTKEVPDLRPVKQTIDLVDVAFEETWRDANLQIADSVDHLTYARRMSLGLAGTVPSLEELRVLESVPEDLRNKRWLEHLLADDRTNLYLAERLARAFVGVENGPFLVYRRSRFVSWLAEQLKQNVPYNQIVQQLLTENGTWTQNPAVNFYSKTIDQNEDENKVDPVLLAGRTSRAFLGMRIDCLQCHDDFLGNVNLGEPEDPSGGTQKDFHSLAAFFSGTQVSLGGIRGSRDPVAWQIQLLGDSEETDVPAELPFLKNLDGKESDPRLRLANWVTHRQNRPFARAIINRMWAIVYGRALMEPVDDIPLAGPFPKPLEIIVDDFIASQYDLRRAVTVIASCKPASLDSQASFEITHPHGDNFAVFPMRRLRPDQVAGAIVQSSSLTTINLESHILDRLIKFGSKNDFVKRFGDPGENEFEQRGETVTQKLLMMNGNMLADRINEGLHSVVHLAALSPDANKLLETIFLTVLSRYPTAEERSHFIPSIDAAAGNQKRQRAQDIYWTLINSVEFTWNH